jgi:spore coat protein U-like protein
MKPNALLLGVAVALAGLPSLFASAATVTASSPVTASVVANCMIQMSNYIQFGSYDAVNNKTTEKAGNNLIAYTLYCTKGTVGTMSISQGVNADAASTCDAPLRRIKSAAGNMMSYDLYTSSDKSQKWGCGTSNVQSFTSIWGQYGSTVSVYGFMPAGQDAPAGSYTDSVTVTINW